MEKRIMKNTLSRGLFRFLGGLLLSMPLAVSAAELPTEINIISEAWEDSTNEDGTGLYWDIMRLVYEPEGISVKTDTVAYSYGVVMVKLEQADAWLGSYKNETNGVLYPKWHFDADNVSALYKPGTTKEWKGIDSLNGKNVGWIRGYNYHQYFDLKSKNYEVKNGRQAITLLNNGRLDYFLEEKDELLIDLNLKGVKKDEFMIKPFAWLRIYPAFSDSEKGEQLRRLYDERFEKLLKSGEIKKLFDKWGWTTYPFSKIN